MVRLNWRGVSTVESLVSFLQRQGAVALGLAPDFHHSLFVHLHPSSAPGEPEEVDMQGGAELLARIAEISGLEALGKLIPALREAGVQVHVQSPAPIIRIQIPEGAAFAYRR